MAESSIAPKNIGRRIHDTCQTNVAGQEHFEFSEENMNRVPTS